MKKGIGVALFLACVQNMAVAAMAPPAPSDYDPNTGPVKSEYGNLVEESEDAKSAEPKQATPPAQVERQQGTTIKDRARPKQATKPAQAEPGVSQDLWPTITDPSREQEEGELIKPPPPRNEED